MAEVSVIIPCYHSNAVIERSVTSLLHQTFTDWQAVLVSDDGQDYAAVLDSLQIHDLRIRHVSTGKNGSHAANARNVGIDHASCDIITYLDADDTFSPHYLAHILPLVKEHHVVFSNQQFIDDMTGREIPFFDIMKEHSAIFTLDEMPLLMLPPGAVCITHDRRRVPARWYADTIVAEDVLFSLQCYAYADYIYASAEPFYCYYNRRESTTHNAQLQQRFIDQKAALITAIDSGSLLNDTPQLAQTAKRCMHITLSAEKTFSQRISNQPDMLYADCVVHELKSMGIL